MATLINDNYSNAIVGVLTYANDDGICLVECDDPFVHYTVPITVSNPYYATLCIDFWVCIHDGILYRIPELDDTRKVPLR